MDSRHKDHIRKNIDFLIENTKFHELMVECEKVELISRVMRQRIDNLPDSKEHDRHKYLFLKLTKRGPKAYQALITIFINLKFVKAANKLMTMKVDESQYISMHDPATINPATGKVPIQNSKTNVPDGCYPSKDKVDSEVALVPVKKEIRLAKPFTVTKSNCIHSNRKVPCYPMKSKNRGVLFMVNIIDFPNSKNKKRLGADVDEESLLFLFQEFGFTCFSYTNLSRQEFFELLDQLRVSQYLKQTESFVMILMSHGEMGDDMHDRMVFNDGSVVKVQEIEDFFSNIECLNLVNKPKVLVFPFCRGPAPDNGVKVESDGALYGQPNTALRHIPTRSDILVCYATVRGFESLRDVAEGSWYIQKFCRVLAEHAHDTDMECMLKLIGRKTQELRSANDCLQTPAFYNHGFNSLLFFNPGMYTD